jgi:hypothetical protein
VADGSTGTDMENPPAVLVAINPVAIVADATAGEIVTDGGNPLRWARQQIVTAKSNSDESWFSWFPKDNFGAQFRIVNGARTGFPAWAVGTIAWFLLAGALSVLAVRRLRTPAETER